MEREMTPAQFVLKFYPDAKVIRVGLKQLYEVYSGNEYLGKGQSKKAAWKSAYRNLIN